MLASPISALMTQVSRAASSTVLAVTDDKQQAWDSVELGKLVEFLASEAPHFAAEFERIVSLSQGNLSLILYADGITPGSILTAENKRKEVIWYASFLEFGHKLSYEEVWVTLATLKNTLVAKHPAGWSGCTRAILHRLFIDQDVAGKGFVALGKVVRVSFHNLLGDEEALNHMWYIKGASGTVPCAIACSCVNKPLKADEENGIQGLASRDDAIVDITCSDFTRMHFRTDNDVWTLADQVAAATKEDRALEQQMTGINYHENAVLFDMALRRHVRPRSNTFDPMHILYANGIVNSEVMLFLHDAKEEHEVTFTEVRTSLQDWSYPKSWVYTPPAAAFSAHREKTSHDSLKCSATELLSVYPALRHFVLEALSASKALTAQRESLLALFRVCDLVKEATRLKQNTDDVEPLARDLEEASSEYLHAFRIAYGPLAMKFKHHLVMHLASQLRRDKRLITCWPLERKHIGSKQSLEHYHDHQNMRLGGIARMMNLQVPRAL